MPTRLGKTMTRLHPKAPSCACLPQCPNVQPRADTYIWAVPKGSVEGLLSWGKEILDVGQTLNLELLRLLFYYFPRRKTEVSPPNPKWQFSLVCGLKTQNYPFF